jgi:RNA polymerase sigma-70 factor (ECF subfamily)
METISFDEVYIGRLIGGDYATEQHFASYFGELLHIKLRSRVRSPQLVEDIKQETFLRVLKNLRASGMEHPERLGAYVNTVCNNVMFEAFRAESRFTEMGEEGATMIDPRVGADKMDEMFVTRDRKQQVADVLSSLPEKDRSLLQAVFLEEQSKDDVCRRFGVDRGYLRVLLHRARVKFRTACPKAKFAAR